MHPNSSAKQLQLTDRKPYRNMLLIWYIMVQTGRCNLGKMLLYSGEKNKQTKYPPLVEGDAPTGRKVPSTKRAVHTYNQYHSQSRQEWGFTKTAHRDSKQHATYRLIPKALLQTGTEKMQMHLLLCTQYMPQHQGAPAQVSLKKTTHFFIICLKTLA